jgi:Zn-finger nucleic acid-binding protein
MQCPSHDGELDSHITHGENSLTVTYSTCSRCHGYWMDSFSANFIKLSSVHDTAKTSTPPPYYCPMCTADLVQSNGENIPDGVLVYECPQHHGYFFPAGQLAAFKKAQQAKINYHKYWHIAMPNVNTILLGSFLLLLLSGGLLVTFRGLTQQQTIESQAKQTLANHNVYIVNHTTVLITATTSSRATLTVHIPSLDFSEHMLTTDNLTHQLTIPNVQIGTYHYYFTITIAGHSTTSDTFTFTVQ